MIAPPKTVHWNDMFVFDHPCQTFSVAPSHGMRRLALYSSLDHRCVPNRENHSLPWSLTFPCECWHEGWVHIGVRLIALAQSLTVESCCGLTPAFWGARWVRSPRNARFRCGGFGKPPRLVSSDGTTAKSNESKLPPLLCLLHWAAGGSVSWLRKSPKSRTSYLWAPLADVVRYRVSMYQYERHE